MIWIDAPQVSYGNEIVELAKEFFPTETISAMGNETDPSEEDLILKSTWSAEGSESFSFLTTLRKGPVLLGERKNVEAPDRENGEGETSFLFEKRRRREMKNGLKGSVYDLLSSFTGKHPRWGILTGIRPVKIVHELLDRGCSREDVRHTLQEIYRLHPSRVDLMMKTAEVQRPLIRKGGPRTVSVYIHIPFCSSRCFYCSFPSDLFGRISDKIGDYLDCLHREMSALSDEFQRLGISVDTVYIGGGTPTVLAYADLERLLCMTESCFRSRFPLSEYTVEAGRPDSLDPQKLRLLKNYGVTRISINPQSMNQETLDRVGRNHTTEDVARTFQQARETGFDCINMDVILGLPGETPRHMEHTMEAIAALGPENITVHTLAVKRASALKESFHQYDPSRRGLAEEMSAVCRRWTEHMDMVPYYLYRQKYMLDHLENVGYTVPGKECRYNIDIMEEKRSIWAFGAGASSKLYHPEEDRLERVANVKNLEDYISRIGEMIERKRKALGTGI
jgi:oxygen-independent coproporphyrinogen-3 oxidase